MESSRTTVSGSVVTQNLAQKVSSPVKERGTSNRLGVSCLKKKQLASERKEPGQHKQGAYKDTEDDCSARAWLHICRSWSPRMHLSCLHRNSNFWRADGRRRSKLKVTGLRSPVGTLDSSLRDDQMTSIHTSNFSQSSASSSDLKTPMSTSCISNEEGFPNESGLRASTNSPSEHQL